MKFTQFVFLYFFTLGCTYAQIEKTPEILIYPEDDTIFRSGEILPEFQGGEIALIRYLNSYTYPEEALKKGIEGKVFIRFAIAEDGRVVDIELIREVHELLDSTALDLIRNMPDVWKPGYQFGKPVRVQYTVPIRFDIERYLERKSKEEDE